MNERLRWRQRLRSPLSIRVPLLDPDRFLDRTAFLVRPLFGWWSFLAWALVVLMGVVFAAVHWDAITHNLVDQALDCNGIKVLAAQLEGADATGLRETLDKLKDKLKSAAIVLAAVADGKVSLIAGVTPDLTARIKAGDLVNMVAQQVGGKGGGRPDMAMAGGTQPEHLAAALASVAVWVQTRT